VCCIASGISLSFSTRSTAAVTLTTLAGTQASISKLRLKVAGDMVSKSVFAPSGKNANLSALKHSLQNLNFCTVCLLLFFFVFFSCIENLYSPQMVSHSMHSFVLRNVDLGLEFSKFRFGTAARVRKFLNKLNLI